MNINHERLVPGAITYWGDVVGDITDQQDLVDYVASHGGGGGGGDATWGSIQGTLSNQTDLNNRLTEINGLAQEALNDANDVSSALTDHIAANDAAFAEAFSRISALEQGGGGGGVTPEEFNAHKAQNTEEFQIVDGRLTALEQNPGVSQQTFAAHADQNAAQFQAINDQFQNYATNQRANELYQANFDYITATRNELSQSINDVNEWVRNNAVTTEQCQEPGLTDYLLTSLIWTNNNVILAMDDYYTGDNAENRDVTIWGSYMDENDNSRIKFGKVKTTYEQDPNTQEYTVTGQTFGEMMTLTRKEDIDYPVVDRPDADIDDGYFSEPYILGLAESFGQKRVDGDMVNTKTDVYTYIDGGYPHRKEQHYVDDGNGGWDLETELEFEPAWIGNGWDVLQLHDLESDPNIELPENYPVSGYYDVSEEYPIGYLNEGEWMFTGIRFDPDFNLGKYKIEGVEDGSEITYEETFIPFIAAEAPDTDGTYVLKATVQDGEVTYEWVPDNVL